MLTGGRVIAGGVLDPHCSGQARTEVHGLALKRQIALAEWVQPRKLHRRSITYLERQRTMTHTSCDKPVADSIMMEVIEHNAFCITFTCTMLNS